MKNRNLVETRKLENNVPVLAYFWLAINFI